MNVIIIDDDPLVVDSLKTIVAANYIDVLGIGYSGEDAIRLYKDKKPSLVMLDIRMEGMSGIEATKEILEYDPNAKILLITTFKDDEYIKAALDLGCRGYILKENIKGIIPAIKAIESGNMVFDSKIVENISRGKAKASFHIDLSDREEDILFEIANGLNNKEIAEKLYLSEGTIRNYVSQLLDKLDLRDRTQLAIYYYRQKDQD